MDDSKGGGSFIPKRSVSKPAARAGRRVYIFSYVAYVIFFGTLMAVVGVFVIQQQTQNRLNEVVASVEEAQKLFNREQLDSLQNLDKQLSIAGDLLDQHVAVSRLFSEIEENTLEEVRFTSFTYDKESASNIILSIESQTSDFDQVIVQRDLLAENQNLAGLEVSAVSYGEGESGGGDIGLDTGDPLLGFLNQVGFSIQGAVSVSDFAYDASGVDGSENTTEPEEADQVTETEDDITTTEESAEETDNLNQ